MHNTTVLVDGQIATIKGYDYERKQFIIQYPSKETMFIDAYKIAPIKETFYENNYAHA